VPVHLSRVRPVGRECVPFCTVGVTSAGRVFYAEIAQDTMIDGGLSPTVAITNDGTVVEVHNGGAGVSPLC
jgi:hypothetical protein